MAKTKAKRAGRATGSKNSNIKAKKTSKSSAARRPSKAGAETKPGAGPSASQLIDQRIRELGGWRGQTLSRVRALVLEADPQMVEEWKWNNPVWSHGGIVCTGEAYSKVVKLTFAHGASIADPSRLFNSSLEGNTRRAIDIHEGEQIDASAFKELIRAAANHNAAGKTR